LVFAATAVGVVEQRRDVGVGRGAPDDLVDRRRTSQDGGGGVDEAVHGRRRVCFGAQRLDPVPLENRNRFDVAADRDVEHGGEQVRLGAEHVVHRLHRHAGPRGDVLDRGGDVAPVDEEFGRGLDDATAGPAGPFPAAVEFPVSVHVSSP
jgi:hypothetical protein